MQPSVSSADAILAQMERVIGSSAFRRADVAAAFLRFAVERFVSGDIKDLKEYTIAVEVFRRPASYDPQIDSHVRVQAGKLRQRLARYYEREGKDDTVVISLPKGTYVPDIQVRAFPPRRRWMYWSTAAVVLVAVTFAGWSVHQTGNRRMLAVIPIENATGHPSTDYIAAGIGDHVRNSFSQREDISTIGRDTMLRYEAEPGEASSIGRDVGATSVLSGRISQRGDHLSMQAELTDTRTASQIWGGRFEGARRRHSLDCRGAVALRCCRPACIIRTERSSVGQRGCISVIYQRPLLFAQALAQRIAFGARPLR